MHPAEYNPRKKLTPEDPEYIQIRNSLNKFGHADPIVINFDGTIIKGHQRRMVMMDLGYTEADVIVLDIQDNDDEDPFPYVIVRIDSGGIDSQADPHKVALVLLIGIYDDDKSNQGHTSVLEIIERIQRHYEEKPLLENQFKFIDPFNWALQDEESCKS